MNYKLSFTDFVKSEILKYKWNKKENEILIYSLVFTILKKINNNKISFRIHLTNKLKNDLFLRIKNTISPQKLTIKNFKNSYEFCLEDEDIFNKINNYINELKIDKIELAKSYISGAFLAKGSISSPVSKYYHFEISTIYRKVIINLQEVFNYLGIKVSITSKRNYYYLYVKKAILISDILKILNSSNSLMYYEDQRILRDITSNLKKSEAIESYNNSKTLQASKIQIEAINKLKNDKKFNSLKKEMQNLANLRLKYPDLSLIDLNYQYNKIYKKNLSKSTINNWIKIIVKKANES